MNASDETAVPSPTRLGVFRITHPSHSPAPTERVVWEAHDESLNRVVTIVRLAPGNGDSQRQRFLRGARKLAGCRHRNLCTVFEIADAADVPYFVVERVSGGTLRDWLTHFPPALPHVLQIGCDLADALVAAARDDLTPVDLGPDNVWLERPEQHSANRTIFPVAKLRDFRPFDPQEPDAARAALRALARLLHRLLTGYEPTALDPLPPVRSLAPHVPAALAQLVDGLIADDARDVTLISFAERIRSLHSRSPERISRMAWARTAVLAVFVVAFVSGMLSGRRGARSPAAPVDSPSKPPQTASPSIAAAKSPLPARSFTQKEPPRVVVANAQDSPPPPAATPVVPPPEFEPLAPDWMEFVGGLPAKDSLQAAVIELRRRNPSYSGAYFDADFRGDKLRGLIIMTDDILDISPLRALPNIEWLNCPGSKHKSGRLEDISPLAGTRLHTLRAGWTRIRDLSPLSGLPLRRLYLGATRVEDLSPLANLPLEELQIWNTLIRDLAPLRTLPKLGSLDIRWVLARDLSPLAELPLTTLRCEGVDARDWTPLGKLPLETLTIDYDPGKHGELLRGIPTLQQINGKPAAEVLGP